MTTIEQATQHLTDLIEATLANHHEPSHVAYGSIYTGLFPMVHVYIMPTSLPRERTLEAIKFTVNCQTIRAIPGRLDLSWR